MLFFSGSQVLKKYFFLFVICFSAFLSYAQTVSEEEILSIKDQISNIIFKNYVGPHTEISSREEISGIGQYLGENSLSSPSWGDKYRLYHSFHPEIPEGLDADILAILENAGVDHITNLRRIISGYLQSVYDYSGDEGAVLSKFITYYNAIYYKNIKHFASRYKEDVMQYITAENAGLSTHYSEWAGKSRIVIPLSSDSKMSLDTSIISQPEVVDEMRKEEDKALETRKDMVEIREEELDEKQLVLDEEQEVLSEEKEELKEVVREKEKELEKTEEGSPEEELIKEEIQVLEEKEKVLEEKQEAITEEQEKIEKEQDEVHEMRKDIAEDENILKKEEDPVVESIIASTDGKAFWFVLIEKQGDPASFGTLCKITENGDILEKSGINSIRGNSAIDTGTGIALIAGRDASNSTVNVILIDQKSLELLKQSKTNVYAGNTIWTEKNNLYIITRNNSDWVLGKYSYDLDLLSQSDVCVHPDSAIQFEKDKLLIQNSKGTISVLSTEDLSEIQR